MVKVHLLLDLTSSGFNQYGAADFLTSLTSQDSLGGVIENATVLLPTHISFEKVPSSEKWLFKSGSSIRDAELAMQFAADSRCHLLILFGPATVGSEVLGTLLHVFDIDPHFGVSVPRQLSAASGELFKVAADLGDPEITTLSRRILGEIPEYYILPEILTPCVLVRDLLVSNLPGLDESYETLAGAVQDYLSRVRRAGFRTVVINNAGVPVAYQNADRNPLVSKADTRKLHTTQPDAGKAKAELADESLHLRESLLGRLFSPQTEVRKTLLLDIRGVPKFMNGTAEAVLALCDGLRSTVTEWNISLLAEPASIEHHQLDKRYGGWPLLTDYAGHKFSVAFRPSQPWQFSTIIELHRTALLNFYAMLDTIAWDILYEAPRGLGACWEFLTEYADGLLYNSFETRDHVLRRFPLAGSRQEFVFHHSFHPDDYTAPSFLGLSDPGEYIFVIGNEYDHKNLGPTVDLLSSSFPFQEIKVLGLRTHGNPRTHVVQSGRVPTAEVDALFANARCIVFPSFYEGFGLPVLKGLSYGRTVVARDSALLREVAGHYRGPGKLVPYSTAPELVDAVGKLTHGHAVDEIALGTKLADGQVPKSWREIARGVLDFLNSQIEDPKNLQWPARERAIRQLDAYCS